MPFCFLQMPERCFVEYSFDFWLRKFSLAENIALSYRKCHLCNGDLSKALSASVKVLPIGRREKAHCGVQTTNAVCVFSNDFPEV